MKVMGTRHSTTRSNVGLDFDTSRSDDFFYIPHAGFDNEDVKTGMQLLMSSDGKAARFIVTHEGDAMGPEGVDHVNAFPEAMCRRMLSTREALTGPRFGPDRWRTDSRSGPPRLPRCMIRRIHRDV